MLFLFNLNKNNMNFSQGDIKYTFNICQHSEYKAYIHVHVQIKTVLMFNTTTLFTVL